MSLEEDVGELLKKLSTASPEEREEILKNVKKMSKKLKKMLEKDRKKQDRKERMYGWFSGIEEALMKKVSVKLYRVLYTQMIAVLEGRETIDNFLAAHGETLHVFFSCKIEDIEYVWELNMKKGYRLIEGEDIPDELKVVLDDFFRRFRKEIHKFCEMHKS